MKLFHTDISFATTSPIRITNDKESRRSVKLWKPTEIEKIHTQYGNTYALVKSIEPLESSAMAKFHTFERIDPAWSIKGYGNYKVLRIYGLNIKPSRSRDNCLGSVVIDIFFIVADDLKIIKASKLILNNSKIDNTIPLGLFSRLGILIFVTKILMPLIKQIFYITVK